MRIFHQGPALFEIEDNQTIAPLGAYRSCAISSLILQVIVFLLRSNLMKPSACELYLEHLIQYILYLIDSASALTGPARDKWMGRLRVRPSGVISIFPKNDT
jgi:hypothetical protein